ncbi:MAG: SDR family oxidoreductase [Comamonadaceae bacterium]|nr:MAG: SDR family oxidoreductase [Comamonadaceae bacterium]
MELELKGKIAVVGGGSQGIGYGIARVLAGEGATVAISARREADLEGAAKRLREETGATILTIPADCRKAEDCSRVVATVKAAFGGVDILVNNDGAPPMGELTSFDDTAWSKAVEQNLMYVVRMAREVVPLMRERGGGSILNVTALSALQPMPQFGLSVATWAAVIGYAKTLSLEVAASNISVNTICPGYVDTGRLDKALGTGTDGAHAKQRLAEEVPMKRIGQPEDIGNLVALLVSGKGRYITGTAIQVDGGSLRAVR